MLKSGSAAHDFAAYVDQSVVSGRSSEYSMVFVAHCLFSFLVKKKAQLKYCAFCK